MTDFANAESRFHIDEIKEAFMRRRGGITNATYGFGASRFKDHLLK
jgi:hypothetical protein